MWKWFKWVLLLIILATLLILFYYFNKKEDHADEIPRIPSQVCPDKEFEGQGDAALYYKGKKYYTEQEDWDWIVNNCSDYGQYKD